MTDAAVIVYHRNATRIYERRWLDRCVASIEAQTMADFDILEVDYGGDAERLFPSSRFASQRLPTFADAANVLLDRCVAQGYEVMFNVHVDDFYAPERFAAEVAAIDAGADLVSTDFAVVDADDQVLWTHDFHDLDIASEFANGHNIMCHPSVAYTARFWRGCSRYRPDEIPREDFTLWQRELGRWGFQIIGPVLTFCRDHPNRTSNSDNR